jgi:L,D-peptidoglycan transpeptidase YkuD (ErfK/YbiS/YcfS/YnhG family)
MIIINKSGYLKFKNLKFKCSLGKSGIGEKKIEGDNITPEGTYQIIRVYYRKDRIKKIKAKIKLFEIKKNFGWCDQPNSKFYNRLIDIPNKLSHEKLYRKDNVYDVIIVLNYNMNPTIQYKGSAIFIHVAKRKFPPTKGCVAISKKNLLSLIERISKKTKIKIL